MSIVFATKCNAEIYFSISGKVIAEDTGKGLSSVDLVAKMVETNEIFYTSTNEDGTYILTDLKPGTYKISFSMDDSFYISVEYGLEVILPKGKNVANANYVLPLGGAVSGKVYASNGITPEGGITVGAEVKGDQPQWYVTSIGIFSKSDGSYIIKGVPESDNCIVGAEVLGHPPVTKTVKIIKGNTTENVDFILKWDETTGITGYAKSASGRKPPMKILIALWDSEGTFIGQTGTDENEKYIFTGLEPGIYKVKAIWPTLRLTEGTYVDKDGVVVEKGKLTNLDFEFEKY